MVGEVKDVKNGFARNYLLPRGLAGPTTRNNLVRAERLAQADAIRQEKLDGEASPIALAIAGQELTFQARVGEQGRLFGSITARDIAERLTEIASASVSDAVIEHRQVLLPQSLRTLGAEDVRVRLTRNVSAEVRVIVEPDGGQRRGELRRGGGRSRGGGGRNRRTPSLAGSNLASRTPRRNRASSPFQRGGGRHGLL